MPNFPYTFSISKLTKDSNGVKTPVGMPNWAAIKSPADCKINSGDKVFCVMTGQKNGITVIDCDSEDAYTNLIAEFPELNSTLTIKTSKGYHIYVKYDENARTTTNRTLQIDVRNDKGIVFGEGSKTEFGTEYTMEKDLPIAVAPAKVWCKLCLRKAQPIQTQTKEEPRRNVLSSSGAVEIPIYCRQILENIDVLYWTDYDDWIRLVWAVKNHFGDTGYKIANEFSKKM